MLRDSVATENISTFGTTSPKAEVSPEEPIFVLTGSQLQEIISRAIQPLQDEVKDLKAIVACLEAKVSGLEATQDVLGENDLNQLRLIADLRKKEPGKTEISRAEKIEKYLLSRPDHKATFETLRGHLGIDSALLNQSIRVLMDSSPGRYGITKIPGDKRKKILVMIPR